MISIAYTTAYRNHHGSYCLIGECFVLNSTEKTHQHDSCTKDQLEDDHLVALLNQITQRKSTAISQLHQLCCPWMFRVALRIIRNHEIAEEVVQEAMLKIWQRSASFNRSKGRAKTWIATVVRNQALDVARMRKLPEAPKGYTDEAADEVIDTSQDLAGTVDITAAMNIVFRAMETMPFAMRQSLMMSYYQGYTHRDIAEIMQAPVGTIKAWIKRGRHRVRQSISSEELSQLVNVYS